MLCSTGKVKSESVSRSVMSTWPPKLFCPCDFPGKNIRVGCHFLLQECFLNQGSNPGLPGCRQILYPLRHQGSLRILEWVAYPFSSGSSQSRNQTRVSCIAGRFFYQLNYQGTPITSGSSTKSHWGLQQL